VKELLEEVRIITQGGEDPSLVLEMICRLLERNVPHYHWVGFYISDPNEKGVLYLGPYVGAPTEHTRIAFGKGICGQAAAKKENFIIQDVSAEDNYLSCSVDVRSEIVIPIMDGDTVLGELDIDSHDLSPFTDADPKLLEGICRLVVPLIRELRGQPSPG